MRISQTDVARVRFMREAPMEMDPPGTVRLTAVLYDGRLFSQRPVYPRTECDFVGWVCVAGHTFASPVVAGAFRDHAEGCLAELGKAA